MKKKGLWMFLITAVFVFVMIGLTSCDFLGSGSSSYSITFYVDGDAIHTINVTPGTNTITLPPEPSKSGYVFDDWYYDKDIWQRPFTVQSLAGVNSNVKLYARWLKRVTASYYTEEGGELFAVFELTEGSSIPLPASDPARTGYTFTGWRDAADGAVPAQIGASDLQFFARFLPNKYRIYLGIPIDAGYVPVSATAEILSDESSGYYFEVLYNQPYALELSSIDVSAGGLLAYWKRQGGIQYIPRALYTTAGDTYLEPSWALEGTPGVLYEYISAGDYADTYRATGYDGSESEVILAMYYNGRPVSSVAFTGSHNEHIIESLVIQNSVLTIGSGAFASCTGLEEAVIPFSVVNIGPNAFPASADIVLYSLRTADDIPSGWDGNWTCGNRAIFNNGIYEEQFFNLSSSEDFEVSFLFDVVSFRILDAGGIPVSVAVDATYSPDKKTLTLSAEDLARIPAGTYTFESTGRYIMASFPLVLGFSNSFVYDKNTGGDLSIYYNSSRTAVMMHGSGITEDDYSIRAAESIIVLEESYLTAKKGGTYPYLIVYEDGASEIIEGTVFDSEAAPYHVKLDLDSDPGEYTILFDCDYDKPTTFSYRIDGGPYLPCMSGDSIPALAKSVTHTLEVKCDETGKTGSFMLPILTPALSYLSDAFTYNGYRYDYYIADQSELNAAFAYLAQLSLDEDNLIKDNPDKPFGYVQKKFYISEQFPFDNEALTDAAGSLSFIYNYGYFHSQTGQIATIQFTLRCDQNQRYATGQTAHSLADGSALMPLAVPETSFAIDSLSRTELIDSVYELDNLPYGVRPSFPDGGSDAEDIYLAARQICGLYIDNDLTDYQKVAIIYEWLAIHVTYDNAALDIMALQNDIAAAPSLASAKTAILSAVNANGWNADFEAALLAAKDSATSKNELVESVEGIIKSLDCFSLYGVFWNAGNRVAVCDGYASAFKLMCMIEGIECKEVTGWAGENHAWNKVKIDGEWFVVDATWARMRFTAGTATYYAMRHQWLLISDAAAFSYASQPRTEYINWTTPGVADLAAGVYNYYSSVSIGGGYDLIADTTTEMAAVLDYYKNLGRVYAEVVCNSEDIGAFIYSAKHKNLPYVSCGEGVYLIDISTL
jgi:uncharacterized repeat protein (TIGR02543 family)